MQPEFCIKLDSLNIFGRIQYKEHLGQTPLNLVQCVGVYVDDRSTEKRRHPLTQACTITDTAQLHFAQMN